MPKKTPKKESRKTRKRPTQRQIAAAKKLLESIGKQDGKPLGEIVREAGYSEAVAKNPQQVLEGEGFKTLMDDAGLDMKSLAASHKELLDQKRVEYFVFPSRMEDKEIEEHVKAAGLTVIVIRKSDRGKLAFYSTADVVAKKAALEMGYRIQGAFGKTGDGGVVVPIQINNLLGGKRQEYGI